MPLENIQKGEPDSSDFADIELADVIDAPALQEMMDDYYALTNIGVGIIDLHGNVLVSTGWQEICVRFHRSHPESCAHCRESDLSLSRGVPPGTFKEYRCKNNMWDIATPIMLGERHVGNIFLGQFFYDDEEPDYELFRAQARRFGYDEAEYLAALERVPRWSRETVQRAMGFYAKLAGMISRSNYDNVILAEALTRSEEAERTLRDSEVRHRTILQTAMDGFWRADRQGRLLEVNESYCRMSGYSADELLAMRVTDVEAAESAEMTAAHLKKIQERGEDRFESRHRRKDGSTFAVEVSVMYRPEAGDQFVAFFRDISARKEAEETLLESEEKFSRIFHSAPSILSISTLDEGRFLDVNDVFEQSLGYGREEIIGRTSIEMGLWDYQTRCAFIQQLKEQGVVREQELQFRKKNGEFLIGMVSAEIIEVRGQKRLLILINDITERKLAETALQESQEKFAAAFRISPDSININRIDDGVFIDVNEKFTSIFGYSASEVIGRSSTGTGIWVNPDNREWLTQQLRTHGFVEDMEAKLRRKDGSIFDALVSSRLIELNHQPCTLNIARDITAQKRSATELAEAKEAAEASNRAKSQFLANMSHELRTPMTGVLGMLDLALSGNLEAEQREFIELAQTSARSLVRILNDILDLTKIEMGKLSLEENPFSIRQCVQTTHNILLPVAKTKGLDLDFTVADDVPELLLGDQTRLNQVLTNLAGNAVKFTQKGQVAIRVAASGVTPGGRREFTFTVADTGIGIPNDKQHLLFQVFSQVNGSHSRSYGGSGLGLAISKELVERMGGAISFTSEEGKGSIFSFTIPFAEAEIKRTGKTAPAGDAPLAAEITKPRLLVAEDEPTIRQVLGLMLQRSNYEVDFAEDGEQVVEMWDRGHYDLILMDVQMPRKDGFEATAAIRLKEQTRGGHIPIVAMTAHAFTEDEERCLVAGMDAYIAKPIDFKKSLQVIEGIIRQKPEIL